MNTQAKRLSWMIAILATAVLTLTLAPAAAAQNDDPPSRVARIRYLQGSVSFQPAGESDWVSAVTNRPMTTGDQLWADADSRAEVQIGSAMIRMGANTGFSFLNLDDRTVQIQLTEGTLNLRVHRLGRDEVFEVDTPNQAFSVTRAGQYRVEAGADGNSSVVIVRLGQGEVTGGGRIYNLASGQSGTFNGTDSLDGYVAAAGDPDDFDNWGQSRDRQYSGSQSARYVSRDVVGYEDLDNNGSWHSDPSYGDVWMPTSVQSGWAPYHNGHWVWISPWGWTWVDDAPWGYAPFHYGRWVSMRGNWGWVPGPMNYEPVYAPALVAFIGGSNFGVSVSVGGGGYGGGDVGWFPLGPREVYVPSYNTSRGYVDRVNTSNTNVSNTTITNVYNNQVTNINSNNRSNITYVNQAVPGAVTAVPQNAFRSAQPVARAAIAVDAKQIASAPVVSRAAVAPTRNSLLGTAAPSANRVAQPPAAAASRPVVAKATPPPPPVPFAKQEQELAKHPGQPLAAHEVQSLRPANVATAQPKVKQAPPGKPATLNTSRPVSQPMVGSSKQPVNAQPPTAPANKQNDAPANTPADRSQPVSSDRPSAVQQQADKTRGQQAAQQQADKTREQQAAQQAAQQQAEKVRGQQAAQQQADKTREQQAAQQAAQQQAEKVRAQQQAQKAHEQKPVPPRTDRPPSAQPSQHPNVQPAQQPAKPSTPPLTPAEKAREEQKKQEEKPPPQ